MRARESPVLLERSCQQRLRWKTGEVRQAAAAVVVIDACEKESCSFLRWTLYPHTARTGLSRLGIESYQYINRMQSFRAELSPSWGTQDLDDPSYELPAGPHPSVIQLAARRRLGWVRSEQAQGSGKR